MMDRDALHGGLLSIGQFSEMVGASRSQLLYYDRCDAFSPALRVGAGQQASNRRYTLDQVMQYRMFGYFQQMGCTLEEARGLMEAPWTERLSYFSKRQDQLEQEMRRLETMRESVSLLLKWQRMMEGTRPELPAFDVQDAPVYGVYHAIDPPCARTTARFAQAYICHDEAVRNDPDILPGPTLLSYSVEIDADGRFPVTGILSLFRTGCGREKSNYVLPAGRYMLFRVSGQGGRLGGSMLANRQYMIDHAIKRAGAALSCDMGIVQQAGDTQYNECVRFPVCEGITPPGMKPTTPGVA